MSECITCKHRCVNDGFAYFCRRCYRDAKDQFRITNTDFRTYINRSFKTRFMYPCNWRFAKVHERIQQYYPSIKPLAVVLESILFLK